MVLENYSKERPGDSKAFGAREHTLPTYPPIVGLVYSCLFSGTVKCEIDETQENKSIRTFPLIATPIYEEVRLKCFRY